MNIQNKYSRLAVLLTGALASLAISSIIQAGPGHDHAEPAVQVADSATVPTLIATSDLYEVVGTVSSGHMTIYLDKTETNEPVTDAQIDIDFDGTTVKATPAEDGTFSLAVPSGLGSKESTPVTVTILAATGNDLLAGEYVQGNSGHSLLATVLWAIVWIVILALLACGFWLIKRKHSEWLEAIQLRVTELIRSIKK